MERWHLPSIDASGKREPRVLFSGSECRAVVVDLNAGEELRDHRLHERAVVQVVSGSLRVVTAEDEAQCDAGTLVTFAAGETRSVLAIEPSRILLLLVPWPGEGHYPEGEEADPERMPPNSVAPPLR